MNISNNLHRILSMDGFVKKGGEAYYHICDLRGSVRRVINGATGKVEDEYHYYPFGGHFGECTSTAISQKKGMHVSTSHRFGGKEEVRCRAMSFLDFPARPYDAFLCQFWTDDPLREKYYGFGPRLYCGADPVNAIDPTGMKIEFSGTDDEVKKLKDLVKTLQDSELFSAVYNALDESSTVFTLQYGEIETPDGEIADGAFIPSTGDLVISPSLQSTGEECLTIGEETYHAYQTITPSIIENNIEFEAKAVANIEMMSTNVGYSLGEDMKPFVYSMAKMRGMLNGALPPITTFSIEYNKCGSKFVSLQDNNIPAYHTPVHGVPSRLYFLLNKIYPSGLK